MLKKTLFLTIVYLSVQCGGVRCENLVEVYLHALKSDPGISAAYSRHSAVQEKVSQARSTFFPRVSISSEAGANHGRKVENYGQRNNLERGGYYDVYGYTVSATQSIYNRESSINYEQSKLYLSIEDENLKGAHQELILKSASAYFDVLLAETVVELTEKQKQAIIEQLDQAKGLFDSGLATITDVHEAIAQHDSVLADEVAARSRLQAAKIALSSLTHVNYARLARVKEDYQPSHTTPSEKEFWVEQALTDNLRIRKARKNIDNASLEVQKAKSGHYPRLDLVGSWYQNKGSGAIDNENDYRSRNAQIKLQLSIPIFQGGGVSSLARERIAMYDVAYREYDLAQREILNEVEVNYADVDNAIMLAKAYRQAVISAEVALTSGQIGKEFGIRTNLDVLNAQQKLYNNKKLLAEAYLKYFISYLKLKASANKLTEMDVYLLNDVLEQM